MDCSQEGVDTTINRPVSLLRENKTVPGYQFSMAICRKNKTLPRQSYRMRTPPFPTSPSPPIPNTPHTYSLGRPPTAGSLSALMVLILPNLECGLIS